MRLRSLLFFLLIACALPTHAWNATGHEVVAQVAWRDLKPATQEKITALLKQHPHYARYLVPAETDEKTPAFPERAFMLAATWPDIVRGLRSKEESSFHHAEWHYVNYALIPEGTDRAKLTLPDTSDKWNPANNPANILQALQWAEQKLKDKDAPARDKGIALAWMLHLGGDVHQPLHSVALFSNAYPAGDHGGNLFIVKYHNVPTDLHTFWDHLLGGYATFRVIDAVAAKVAEGHPRSEFEKQLAVTSYTEWANESAKIARESVYQNLTLQGVTKTDKIAKAQDIPELPEGYETNAKDVAATQAALAGHRLADLLGKIFAD